MVPITRNGTREEVFWTYSYSPIDDVSAHNGVGGVLVVCSETTEIILAKRRDLTERKRLEQMFVQAPSFMAMLRGPEHTVELANAAYLRLIGHRDILGKTIAEALPDAVAQGYLDLLDEVYRRGKAYSSIGAKYAVEVSPGAPIEERYVDFIFQPIVDATGLISGIFVEGSDVTERVQGERLLRTLNETLEQRVADALAERKILADVVESTDAFIQVLDLDFRLLAINKANSDEFERVYGVRPKVGDDLIALLAGHPAHQQQVKARWSRALAGDEFSFVEEFDDPSRGIAFYEIKFNILRDHHGKQAGACNIAYDVTQRMLDRAARREAEEKVLQAQKIEALGQLTGGVAHDFNNLLMVISGGIDLIDRHREPARRERILVGMRQAVERGKGLSRQLLSFSRRQPLCPEPINLSRQIGHMRELLDRSLRGDIHVRLKFADDLWPVEVDPGELELAILNLAVNARDAMVDGGTITVSADNLPWLADGGLSGDFVRLSVTDTGAGIPPDILARVFEPFFTTKDFGKGSGLGLAQTHGFAHASGGAVRILSTPGEGTTVSLLLPRTYSTPVARQQSSEELSGKCFAPGSEGLALVVEDDDEVAALTVEMIQQLGYETVRVASAAAALGALANGRAVDLVFSDVMMPGPKNGIELASEIRRRHPKLPVVLTSGYADDAIRLRIKAEGVTLLPKPFRLEELAQTLAVVRP